MTPTSTYQEEDPIKIDLKTICDHFDKEDIDVREAQVRYWKRLKYYWNNFSQVYWSERDSDYRIWGSDDSGSSTGDQAYYDRPVNVFKAFLETIIAALSIQIPSISCVPDDADNPLDLSTAKAGNIISKQIYKHNNVMLLWLHALYIYCTEGMIAYYSYTHSDKKYGTFKKKNYKDEETEGYFCPSCKTELDEEMFAGGKEIQAGNENKFDPSESDDEIKSLNDYSANEDSPSEPGAELEPLVCPNCAVQLDPSLAKGKGIIKRFIGESDEAKSRICIEVYGGLYVKVANYAKNQDGTPYLRLAYECNYADVLEEFPNLWDKVPTGGWSNAGISDPYEQYARLNIQYRNTYPRDLVTVSHFWLRPSSFNILGEKEKSEEYHKKFPNGVRVVKVNDLVAGYYSESLDDHWTLTQNPMSDYLTHQPLGELLTNIQDITNDLISLTIQTIEHGIPITFVDPAVVSLNAYGQVEATPGNLTAAKQMPSGGRGLGDSMHTISTTQLAPETLKFYEIIQQLGQFVSGALPSIFGGAMEGGGDTASEYKMSQTMALQRLQTPWRMMTGAWKELFGKVIPQYMEALVDDERIVEKGQSGDYINVFIRKSETEGKIGDIELDGSDQLPVSEEQQKQIIMELIGLNNMEVFNALIAPENLPFIRKIVRIPEFKLPGEDDRLKQYEEIKQLLLEVPIPDPMSPNGFGTSIPIDPIVDNSQVEGEICRTWLISEAGRLAKKENPDGYANVLFHFEAHITQVNKIAMMAQQQQQQTPDEGSSGKPNTSASEKMPKRESGNNGPVQ